MLNGGNLVFDKSEPQAEKFIRPFMMGKDLIDRKLRYCLWLVDIKPEELNKMPLVRKRVEAVREFRLASKNQATQRKDDRPTLFDERVESPDNYIAVPVVSSASLREPYSKPLGDGIFELRTQFSSDIARVLYFFIINNRAVLTHGFIKKTQKTPPEEINRAKQYRKDYLQRSV